MDRPSLSDALDSVALQTYANIEVVVVDAAGAGHRDLGLWCGRFPLRFVNTGRPLKRSPAANLGLDSAQGLYLIFLDDDDLFDPGHIAGLVDALARARNCLVAYAGVKVEDLAGNIIGVYNEPYSAARFMAGNFIPIHAILFARQLVDENCRFDENFDSYEDWDFWLQIARRTRFIHTSTVSAVYRVQLGDSGMSLPEFHLQERQRQARLAVWAKWWPDWTTDDFDCLVANHREQLVSVQETLGNAIGVADGLRAQLAERDSVIAERDGVIAELDSVIAERDGAIEALGQTVTMQLQELNALENLAAKRDQQLDSVNQIVVERDAQITQLLDTVDAILSSTSWRLAAPVRLLGRVRTQLGETFKFGHGIFRTVLRRARAGSIIQLVKRTFVLLRSEGLRGVKARLKSLDAIYRHTYASALEANPEIRLGKHNHPPLSSIDIERYEFFFFDVFDTAIIRLLLEPVDLFEYMAFRAKDPDFARRRVQQEAEARERNPQRKDIDFREIYRDLTGPGIEDEIAAEIKFCVANPEVYAFYSRLVAAGKKVYFVSDMYLDKGTIATILKENGFSTYEDLYVSSEDDLIKGDGSRFHWLKQSVPACVGNAIHIGDHQIADYLQPRTHGFEALHYIERDTYYRHDPFLYSKIGALSSERSLGVSFILGAFRHWKTGFSDQPPDYWRQFGFFYGGALVCAFCGFISEEVSRRNLGCKKIFFLARDGDIMSRVYRMLYPDVEAVYLLASRRCMSFPSFKSLTDPDDTEMLKLFTTPIGVAGVQDVMERFNYPDLHDLEVDLGRLGSDFSKLTDKDIRACIVRNKKAIMDKVREERRVLLDYLSDVGLFADEDIVIADVGWSGTIQNALGKVLELDGHVQNRIHGFYLGVNAGVAHQQDKTGFLFDGDQSEFANYLNLIELITSSPQDGVVRIERTDDGFVPVAGSVSEQEKKRQIVAAEIQKGIIDFAQMLIERDIGTLDFLRMDDFRVLFASLQQDASEEDVFHLGQLKHAMTLGNNFHQHVLARR
jgi:predicted HAD superfamily hydrolase